MRDKRHFKHPHTVKESRIRRGHKHVKTGVKKHFTLPRAALALVVVASITGYMLYSPNSKTQSIKPTPSSALQDAKSVPAPSTPTNAERSLVKKPKGSSNSGVTTTNTQPPEPPAPPTQVGKDPAVDITGFNTPITIRGNESCVTSTLKALKLLSDNAPTHYAVVTQNISIIECAPSGSGMYAYEDQPRYVVGDATRNAGLIWYAGTIAHDAGHSKLYHDYLSAHPNNAVPVDVWTGENAERACLDAQYNALAKLNSPQYYLDYVSNVINTQYYNVQAADRWW